MTRNLAICLILTLFSTTTTLAQVEKLAELQFVNIDGFNCENDPQVCYDVQLRSSAAEPFLLFGVNFRLYFDMAVMEWVSTECTAPGLYICGVTTIVETADNLWGMTMPRWLTFNMDGSGFPDFSAPIAEDWVTISKLCFNVVGTPPDDFCGSLVWDLQQDGEGGFQPGNDGVVVLEQDPLPGQPQEPLDEEVIQYNWTYSDNLSGAPDAGTQCITTNCEPPVSVDLISFNARRSDKVSVLNWVTTNEIDNDHFDIQRSSDGIHFDNIGVVKAAEKPTDINQYNFVDRNPFAGRNYYRLNQVDLDGTAELTYIRSVDFFEGKLKIETYPNPTTDYVFVDLGLEDANMSEEFLITIMDLSGVEIQSKEVMVDAAARVKFDLKSLVAGTYLLKVTSGEIERLEKIVKVD